MASTEFIKLDIISQVTLLNDATLLAQIAHVLKQNTPKNEATALSKLNKLRKKALDIELLKKEQNFTAFNRPRFDQLVKELNIQEPIEQLLQMI